MEAICNESSGNPGCRICSAILLNGLQLFFSVLCHFIFLVSRRETETLPWPMPFVLREAEISQSLSESPTAALAECCQPEATTLHSQGIFQQIPVLSCWGPCPCRWSGRDGTLVLKQSMPVAEETALFRNYGGDGQPGRGRPSLSDGLKWSLIV